MNAPLMRGDSSFEMKDVESGSGIAHSPSLHSRRRSTLGGASSTVDEYVPPAPPRVRSGASYVSAGCTSVVLVFFAASMVGLFLVLMILVLLTYIDVAKIESGDSDATSELNAAIRGVKEGVSLSQATLQEIDGYVQMTFNPRKVFGLYPEQYAVEPSSLTPTKDFRPLNSAWLSSLIAYFEASYRSYGVAQGFLDSRTYVRFSEQALGKAILEFCSRSDQASNELCVLGALNKGSTDGGYAEFLYMVLLQQAASPDVVSNFTKAIIPEAICSFNASSPLECNGYDSFWLNDLNPVRFAVSTASSGNVPCSAKASYLSGAAGLDYAFSISNVKRKLFDKARPGLVHSFLLKQSYLIPCDDLAEDADPSLHAACIECLFPCTASADDCCYQLLLPGYDERGVFYLHGTPYFERGVEQLLVGWNDEFRVANELDASISDAVGGFITKSPLGWREGHSVGYWLGEYSADQENSICPVPNNPLNWNPIDPLCVPDGVSLAELDPFQIANCSSFTVLKCSEFGLKYSALFGIGSCDPLSYYALSYSTAEDVFFATPSVIWAVPEGENLDTFSLLLYRFNQTQSLGTLQSFMTNATTFSALSQVFENAGTAVDTPQNGTILPPLSNDEDLCGFFFLPYSVFDVSSARWGSTWAAWFDITWLESSYSRFAALHPLYDYSVLSSSTYTMQLPNVSDPRLVQL